MAELPPDEWEKWAKIGMANIRPHAGYDMWEGDRPFAEEGTLADFVKAVALQGPLILTQAQHRGWGNDPPDCEARDDAGGRIAIELTELVDGPSIAAARAGQPYDWKDWRQDLLPALQHILNKKDAKTPKDPPYEEYVLVVHTDEPWMELERTRRDLAGHVFQATSLITRAYLLISYDPWEKRRPCIRLNIAGRAPGAGA